MDKLSIVAKQWTNKEKAIHTNKPKDENSYYQRDRYIILQKYEQTEQFKESLLYNIAILKY